VIAHDCGTFDALLVALANASVDPSTSSCTVPAIAALARAMDSRVVNAFFIRLMHERIVPFAADSDHTEIPCALVDVALALLPLLDDENRDVFYRILLSLVRQQNHFQKKALRALRQYLMAFPVASASADLSAALAECTGSRSSSVVRYRLLLMATLLKLPNSDTAAMMNVFIPEFVAALKETGLKARAAAAAALLGIAADTVAAEIPLTTLLSGIASGLSAESPAFVSASMDGIDLVVARHFDAIEPAELCAICAVVWKATETAEANAVCRSALKFAKTLLARVRRFVEAEQLPNVLMLGVHCVKRPNWEIKGKGHKMIERCIDHFGIDAVTRAFPPGQEKLLRGARKESRRENRPEAPTGKRDPRPKIELDARFDEDVHDLLDPGETITRPPEPEDAEGFELDEKGRLKLKDAPKRKTRAVKEAADSDYDEEGNDVHQMKNRQKDKSRKPIAVATAAEKAKTPKGRAEERKERAAAFSFTPRSPKVVSKRNRAVMKAEYRRMFETSK
jgi:hypothetical protein